MNTNGLPVFSERCITSATLSECTSPAEPPMTVKSWLARWTRRPSTEAAPVTTPSAGISLPARPKFTCRCCANKPNSSKLCLSTKAAIRSRALTCLVLFAWPNVRGRRLVQCVGASGGDFQPSPPSFLYSSRSSDLLSMIALNIQCRAPGKFIGVRRLPDAICYPASRYM